MAKNETTPEVNKNIVDPVETNVGEGVENSVKPMEEGKTPKSDKKKTGVETVEVNKTDLKALFDKLEKQAEDIKVLYQVADKSRLQRFDPSEKEAALIKTARAWSFEDKIVVATKLITNQSDIINGKAYEDQKLLVMFESGGSQEMRYRDFEVHKKYVVGEIVSVKSENDETYLTLRFGDGRKVELSAKFIN
jgi:hypothetical protein